MLQVVPVFALVTKFASLLFELSLGLWGFGFD
jgi:hypothetical protein